MSIEIDLSGRVALVTGGSRGLGRADALTLARAGADVVIADLLVESELSEETDSYGPLAQVARTQGLVGTESAADEIRAMGRRALAVRCDVTDRDQVAAAVSKAVDELGSVDILVNNAGTLDHVGQFGDQQPELWERDLRVNLSGAFNCAQAVWPHMKERKWGRIVNMASVAGTLGGFGQASYSTTKAGLFGLTKTLAHGGRPARDHGERNRPRDHRDRGVPHGEPGDERAHRQPDRVQAPRRAPGHRERDRLPLLRPRRLRHRDRAERLGRRRAVRVLEVRCGVAPGISHRASSSRRNRGYHATAVAASSTAVRTRRRVSAGARIWVRLAVLRSSRALIVVALGLVFAGSPAKLAQGTRIAGLDVGGPDTGRGRRGCSSGGRRASRDRPGHLHGGRQERSGSRRAGSASQADWATRPSRTPHRTGAGFGLVRGYRRLGLEFFPQDRRAADARLRRRRSPTSSACSAAAIDTPHREARLVRRGLHVTIAPGSTGRVLDRTAARAVIVVDALASLHRGAGRAAGRQRSRPR